MTLSRKWYSDHFEGIILCILNIIFYLNKKYKVHTPKKKKKSTTADVKPSSQSYTGTVLSGSFETEIMISPSICYC